jgi:hypothetical protein
VPELHELVVLRELLTDVMHLVENHHQLLHLVHKCC